MDRESRHIVCRDLDLAGMEARPDVEVDARGPGRDLPRRLDRPAWPIEGGEDAVSGRLDDPATATLDGRPDQPIMSPEQLAPRVVPYFGRTSRRADDIGEEDGRQPAVETSAPTAPR